MESAEKTKDSRLARQLIVALPVELGRDDWLLLLRGFIQTECVDKGMCADFAIHDPDGHNPHAHIMLTMRPLDVHGKWQGKTQKEYLCRKADEKRGFTAQEFLQAKEDGWEKQFKYRNTAGVSAWLTPTQAAREPGWGRCSKQPKAAKFGRQNPLCARWNSPEQLLDWREAWADAVNRALKEKQQPARVTHPQQKFTGRYRPLLPWMIFCSQKLNSARNKLQQTPVTMLFSLGNQQNLHAELLHRKIRCCGKHPIGQAVLKPAAV